MAQVAPNARIHPIVVRVTHWINAAAVICMILSGWQIYNASPFFGFRFPTDLTLGGWLAGALAIHFAAMWLLAANFVVFAGYGLASGRYARLLRLPRLGELIADLVKALRFRLVHKPGTYNAVQRVLYVVVLASIALVILSGLALWKPVQLRPLSLLFGGYEATRRVHFAAMAAISGFVVVHVVMVAIVPRTLVAMLAGGQAERVR
jgi:thiosulfate reductase cytochrome b subunit